MILWFGKKKKKQELEEAGKAIEASEVVRESEQIDPLDQSEPEKAAAVAERTIDSDKNSSELEQDDPPPRAGEVARESGSEGAAPPHDLPDTFPLRPSGISPARGGG